MLSVVTWKWKPKRAYHTKFDATTVNVMRRMVARHYPKKHRFICVTDDPKGLDPEVHVVPMWDDFSDIPNPSFDRGPSCYRRLKAFSPAARDLFGDRFASIDLDCVIVDDLRPVWDRDDDFIIWGDTAPKVWYNGSLWLMSAGARAQVWDQFDPKTSPARANRAGQRGSDQGWIGHVLGPGEKTWSKQDGVYSFRNHIQPNGGVLPDNARVIIFHGLHNPWDADMQRRHPWIKEHWC